MSGLCRIVDLSCGAFGMHWQSAGHLRTSTHTHTSDWCHMFRHAPGRCLPWRGARGTFALGANLGAPAAAAAPGAVAAAPGRGSAAGTSAGMGFAAAGPAAAPLVVAAGMPAETGSAAAGTEAVGMQLRLPVHQLMQALPRTGCCSSCWLLAEQRHRSPGHHSTAVPHCLLNPASHSKVVAEIRAQQGVLLHSLRQK